MRNDCTIIVVVVVGVLGEGCETILFDDLAPKKSSLGSAGPRRLESCNYVITQLQSSLSAEDLTRLPSVLSFVLMQTSG